MPAAPRREPVLRAGWMRACALLLVIGAGAGAAPFEALVVDRVVDGGFENGFVSLTLPPRARFPLFTSGWAARGTPVPTVVEDTGSWEGGHHLDLRGEGTGPVQLLQDLPVATPATALRLAFQAVDGTQVVRLLTAWDRRSSSSARSALELRLGPGGIELRTPTGSWWLERRLLDGRWHRLEVRADPRAGVQTLTLDDQTVLSVPGVAAAAPRTLLLEAPGDRPSHFRWDDLGLAPLPDLELQLLRSRALLDLDAATARWLLPRLDGAAIALSRGYAGLALPELRAAREQLAGTTGPAARRVRDGLAGVIDLLVLDR